MASSAARKVLVPIGNGTEPMEAVITIDVLRRAGADVTVASVENQLLVEACHGVKIVADALISECSDGVYDLISLPGEMPGATALTDSVVLENMVKLSSSATAVESRVQQLDGKVVTSRGPGTAMEFSLALVEQLYGKEKADEVSEPLVMRSNHGEEYTVVEVNWMKWTFDNSPRILVPIANGTEEMEAVIIIDVLRQAKAVVVVASVEDEVEILASQKVKLVADMLLDEAAKLSYDLIVLPGGLGGAETFAKSERLVNLLQKQRKSNKPYGAICASPALVLEPHGLLKAMDFAGGRDGFDDVPVVAPDELGALPGPHDNFIQSMELQAEHMLEQLVADRLEGKCYYPPEAHVSLMAVVARIEAQVLLQVYVLAGGHGQLIEPYLAPDYPFAPPNPDLVFPLPAPEAVPQVPQAEPIPPAPDMHVGVMASVMAEALLKARTWLRVAELADDHNRVRQLIKQHFAPEDPFALPIPDPVSPPAAPQPGAVPQVPQAEPIRPAPPAGKKATAFPALCNKLSDPSEPENRVVVDGNLITSRGPGTSMEFSLAIVEKFFGREEALGIAKIMDFTRA